MTTKTTKPKTTVSHVGERLDDGWMGFRGFIRRNPLTGFWSGVALGVGAGILIGALAI